MNPSSGGSPSHISSFSRQISYPYPNISFKDLGNRKTFQINHHSLSLAMLNLRLARPAQVWSALGGAIILLIAFTHLSSKGGITEVTKDWTAGISKSLMRGSVKSIMEKSEKLWEKTVQQRREIRARFPDMPL